MHNKSILGGVSSSLLRFTAMIYSQVLLLPFKASKAQAKMRATPLFGKEQDQSNKDVLYVHISIHVCFRAKKLEENVKI